MSPRIFCRLADNDFVRTKFAVEGTAYMHGIGFDGTADRGLTTQREAAALDAAVDGAFDRDIATANKVAGKRRIDAEDRVLNSRVPRRSRGSVGASFPPG